VRSQIWWDTARAGGIIAWALASAAVLTGLQQSTRLARRPPPSWVLAVHRYLGALAVVFTGVHLLGLVADSFIGFGPGDLLIPFVSSYRPTEVALGVVAMYLLLAVELSSLAMQRIPRRLWRGIHLSSYVIFVLATIHGLTAGTDGGDVVFRVACFLVAGVVLFMTLVRLLSPNRAERMSSTTS
jgi:predicted ferric reductase